MDTQTIKEKILSGNMTDEELSALFAGTEAGQNKNTGGFQSVVKNLVEAYTGPKMWKLLLETILIIAIVTSILILTYTGRIEGGVTAILMTFSLGFLFGKIQ